MSISPCEKRAFETQIRGLDIFILVIYCSKNALYEYVSMIFFTCSEITRTIALTNREVIVKKKKY